MDIFNNKIKTIRVLQFVVIKQGSCDLFSSPLLNTVVKGLNSERNYYYNCYHS